MYVSFVDIVELSALFWLAFIPIAVSTCVIRLIWAKMHRRRASITLSWYDLGIPFATTAIWYVGQFFSFQTKSMSNISEVGFLGMLWGGAYVLRTCYDLKARKITVARLALYELILTVVSALFTPGFAE